MIKKQKIKKFSFLILFFKYFIIVGAMSSVVNDFFGIALAVFHFVFSFLTFIDEDFEDPEIPDEIDEIGKPLNFTLYAT